MKRIALFAMLAFASLAVIAGYGCSTSATDCGTIVSVDLPPGGTCHTNSHDKAATASSYDANGDIWDADHHVCHIGPC